MKSMKRMYVLATAIMVMQAASGVLSSPLFAAELTKEENFEYVASDYGVGVKITGIRYGSEHNVTKIIIPDTIEDIPVTEIGMGAFEGCTSFLSVELPDSVIYIGQGAFQGCSSLESVKFPASLKAIDAYAFCGCSSLVSIMFPYSLEAIGGSAFSDCRSLVSVKFPASLKTIGEGAFLFCTSLKSVELPASLERIYKDAFNCCFSLPLKTQVAIRKLGYKGDF